MPRLAKLESHEYILDMLTELAAIAKREGLDRLWVRITTVVAAENADLAAAERDGADMKPPRTTP